MGVSTSQQILRYYESYRDTEIIFSKEVLTILRIDPRQIYIKCNGVQWTCIINSASLTSARIIIGTKGGAYAAIQKENTSVSLRFFFFDSHGKSMSFFVNTRVTNIEAYMNSTELAIATLSFNSKPPDDLIEILGRLLETKTNSMNRTEERIPITDDSKRRLSLLKEEALVFVQNIPRNCIVRNLSFSGANVLMMGVPQFLQQKETVLRLQFEDPPEFVDIKGMVIKVENIEGRKDLVALAMKFNDATTPISYKVHVNTCLTAVRKKMLNVPENMIGKKKTVKPQVHAATSSPETPVNEKSTGSAQTKTATSSSETPVSEKSTGSAQTKTPASEKPAENAQTQTSTSSLETLASEKKPESAAQQNPNPNPKQQGRQ